MSTGTRKLLRSGKEAEIKNLILQNFDKPVREVKEMIFKQFNIELGDSAISKIKSEQAKEINEKALKLAEKLKDEKAFETLNLTKELGEIVIIMLDRLKEGEFISPRTPKDMTSYVMALTSIAKLYSELEGKLPAQSNFLTFIQNKIEEAKKEEIKLE